MVIFQIQTCVMFQSVSWHQYWTAIFFLTVIYYMVTYFFYFRSNLKIALKGRKDIAFVNSGVKEEKEMPSLPDNQKTGNNSGDENMVYACIDELTAFFDNQKKSKAVKSALMFSLYTILQKYPSLRSSEYKESLTNIIATQCESICSIHLSADELKGVWFG